MNVHRFIIFFLLITSTLISQKQWSPAGDKIKTDWAQKIDPNNVLNDYPRPVMERKEWKNLNGLWDYRISEKNKSRPQESDGKILVPFAIESSLSGVMKPLTSTQELWYDTQFDIPEEWKGKNIRLNFGAVDWKADVWINDIKVGSHTGGYVPFSFDITPFLTIKKFQKLSVKVWDPSDDGTQPRGKQAKKPESIWYTPVTGIWQTVWLEPVHKKSFEHLRFTSDISSNSIHISAGVLNADHGDIIEVTVFDGLENIATIKSAWDQDFDMFIAKPKLWSPESPFLYKTVVKLVSNGKMTDEVTSYFAMRKISTKRDANGIVRIQLNNKDYFNYGPLDQGWWPDGLYTAPTDEALKYDILKTKEMGFNMIRKHVKVEPARWYTHCDEIGVLVWQDMPSGGEKSGWQGHQFFKGNENQRNETSKDTYKKEWKEIMDYLHPHPSIVVWVPFNEGWGQFDTVKITEWTQKYDPSRLVNSASGGNHFHTGDFLDLHNYPEPKLFLYDAERVTVLGEYGGIGLAMKGHLWKPENNWGYIQFKNRKEVTDEYIKYAEKLGQLIKVGFSAAVYTQTTDVEGEVNGLMTYDRKKDKVDIHRIKTINQKIINVLK